MTTKKTFFSFFMWVLRNTALPDIRFGFVYSSRDISRYILSKTCITGDTEKKSHFYTPSIVKVSKYTRVCLGKSRYIELSFVLYCKFFPNSQIKAIIAFVFVDKTISNVKEIGLFF